MCRGPHAARADELSCDPWSRGHRISRGTLTALHTHATMNTAEAMAQIQTVMSAAEEPVACVLLEAGGKMREVIADHRQLVY